MANPISYTPLEPSFTSSITGASSDFKISGSLYQISTLVYGLLFSAIIAGAFYRYVVAGLWRMEASERGLKKSNEIIKQVTLGLLGIFSLFLILFTINKGMLTGDVNLGDFATSNGSRSTDSIGVGTGNPPSGSSKACDSTANTIAALQSSGGICGKTSCSALSGCNYNEYLPIIRQESSRQGVDYKMTVVIMCKESKGNKVARNKNPNGTFDCGLMQINQSGDCNASILDPATNIARGVSLIKDKTNTTNTRIYPNIPPQAGIFSAYNCCANGTSPHSESADCKAPEFPSTVPKWACPINPGTGNFNMCSVKGYVCDLVACLDKVP